MRYDSAPAGNCCSLRVSAAVDIDDGDGDDDGSPGRDDNGGGGGYTAATRVALYPLAALNRVVVTADNMILH